MPVPDQGVFFSLGEEIKERVNACEDHPIPNYSDIIPKKGTPQTEAPLSLTQNVQLNQSMNRL